MFVTYFPHLIAGPIIHHKEIIPQFDQERIYRFDPINGALGVCIFGVGLFKKTVIADGLAPVAESVFDTAAGADRIGFIDAWLGALAYSFQLYFDFSGYCDMAIGLSIILGIRLPINFNSPYKATSIIEFWRRWHISLSRFLRDYLYIPLGGNRHGPARRYMNLLITMVLGGLWHGAAWTFIAWGALHGFYLLVNHAWRHLFGVQSTALGRILSGAITFLAVVVGWVFFRSTSIDAALALLSAMASPDMAPRSQPYGAIAIAAFIVWFAPNVQEMTAKWRPALGEYSAFRLQWEPTLAFSIITATCLAIGIMSISDASPFIYFNF
jgi:D-alanyl-lipoteichoic acid acyltransferase DltB (MBOAT superfamily)